MNLPGPDALAVALARYEKRQIPPLPGRTNHRHAGILLPLRWQGDTIQLVATRRTSHLRDHAGEVVFPGGKPDPTDADLTATALREAHEELGIHRAQVLGSLSAIPLFTSDFRLFPTVARIDDAPCGLIPPRLPRSTSSICAVCSRGNTSSPSPGPTRPAFPPPPCLRWAVRTIPSCTVVPPSVSFMAPRSVVEALRAALPFDTTRWTWDMTVMGPRRLLSPSPACPEATTRERPCASPIEFLFFFAAFYGLYLAARRHLRSRTCCC